MRTSAARIATTLAAVVMGVVPAYAGEGSAGSVASRGAEAVSATGLHIVGNHFVDNGRTVRLLGVQQQGLEYGCLRPYGYFDGPHNQAGVNEMKTWRINAVRLPVNESCWLGRPGTHRGGAPYRSAVTRYIKLLRTNHLYVIIDNEVASDGSGPAADTLPMPDKSAIAFWSSAARTLRPIPGLILDLYTEPHNVSWKCWRDGCRVAAQTNPVKSRPYEAAGMQSLVNAVRSAGGRQPLLVGGLDWAFDNSRWAQWRPTDPLNQLAVSLHSYGPPPNPALSACERSCRQAHLRLAHTYPVVVGELGEVDCRHGYIDDFMPWADKHGISYMGETWNRTGPGSYKCSAPALLKNFRAPSPTPTRYGVGFRDHLRALYRRSR